MSVFNATRLIGKTVLVTGASSGIGAATAILFAKAGSNVILVARRQEILKQVADRCQAAHKESGLAQGGKFATVQLDVSDKTQVASFFDKVPPELRDIDILVNNAGYVLGIMHVGNISDVGVEGLFTTNVLGLISMTQLLVREFKRKRAGHIINLGSIAGREPYAGGSIYNATKAAVSAFTGALLRELVNTPIRVTEIAPGMVETESSIVRLLGNTNAAKKVYQNPEALTGEDVAEEIVWAASRPPHVNIADVLIYPVNQASATAMGIGLGMNFLSANPMTRMNKPVGTGLGGGMNPLNFSSPFTSSNSNAGARRAGEQGSMQDLVFSHEFMQSVANTRADDPDPMLFIPDGDIDFERDFRQWFHPEESLDLR